jgi:hypothetical protein
MLIMSRSAKLFALLVIQTRCLRNKAGNFRAIALFNYLEVKKNFCSLHSWLGFLPSRDRRGLKLKFLLALGSDFLGIMAITRMVIRIDTMGHITAAIIGHITGAMVIVTTSIIQITITGANLRTPKLA